MKKIVMIMMSLVLAFSGIPVYAQEGTYDIKVECNKLSENDVPYIPVDEEGKEGEPVYTLSAQKRGYDQKIELPLPRCFTLTSEDTDLSDITVEMDTESDQGLGKKDIALKVTSRSEKKATFEANFSSDKVTTDLNSNAGILIKKKDGMLLKRLSFSYSTPALTDEHDQPQFHTLKAWSGKLKYDDDGNQYKISGTVDVYQKDAKISYTYQSLGTYGVKNFLLNSNDYFTFTNGKTQIGAKNGNPGQKNTVTLKCKSAYLKQLKDIMSYDYCNYKIATEDIIFDDIAVEYKNVAGGKYENGISDNGQGCTIGGAMDPIYLAHYATVKPQGKVVIKSYKKTKSSITLKWKKLSVPVSGYMIYRSTKKNSGYKKIKTVSQKTSSYKDKKLKKGKTYYYKIRPYRNVKYQYKVSKKKTKTLSRKAYGSYSSVKKTKTSK